MSIATILKAQSGHDTGQWLMSIMTTPCYLCWQIVDIHVELTDLEILRVEDWYSTVEALPVSQLWVLTVLCCRYWLHSLYAGPWICAMRILSITMIISRWRPLPTRRIEKMAENSWEIWEGSVFITKLSQRMLKEKIAPTLNSKRVNCVAIVCSCWRVANICVNYF